MEADKLTKHESFKKRVRSRMASTGERYSEARRVLLASSASSHDRGWVAAPELSDDAIRSGTGRGWDEWRDLIDEFAGKDGGHKAIATYVRDVHGVEPWWIQAVTVGYERISGLRLPYQMSDGTFTANKSATMSVNVADLRHLLLDSDGRSFLFPNVTTDLKSKPTAKAIRISMGPGVATLRTEELEAGRAKIAIEHKGLPQFDDVAEWKSYWGEWLEAIDDGTV